MKTMLFLLLFLLPVNSVEAQLPNVSAGSIHRFYMPYQKKIDALIKAKGYASNNCITKFFAGEKHSEAAWAKRLHIPLLFLL